MGAAALIYDTRLTLSTTSERVLSATMAVIISIKLLRR